MIVASNDAAAAAKKAADDASKANCWGTVSSSMKKEIMERIHTTCVKYGSKGDFVNYIPFSELGL